MSSVLRDVPHVHFQAKMNGANPPPPHPHPQRHPSAPWRINFVSQSLRCHPSNFPGTNLPSIHHVCGQPPTDQTTSPAIYEPPPPPKKKTDTINAIIPVSSFSSATANRLLAKCHPHTSRPAIHSSSSTTRSLQDAADPDAANKKLRRFTRTKSFSKFSFQKTTPIR